MCERMIRSVRLHMHTRECACVHMYMPKFLSVSAAVGGRATADVGRVCLLGPSYNTSALGPVASLEPFVQSHTLLPLPTWPPHLRSGHFKMDERHIMEPETCMLKAHLLHTWTALVTPPPCHAHPVLCPGGQPLPHSQPTSTSNWAAKPFNGV